MNDEDDYWLDGEATDKCAMCNGTGVISALTNQSVIFVASYADCPACDGTGEAP